MPINHQVYIQRIYAWRLPDYSKLHNLGDVLFGAFVQDTHLILGHRTGTQATYYGLYMLIDLRLCV